MSHFQLSQGESLYYEYTAPANPSSPTFVFFNALTGDTAMWSNGVAGQLLAAGHGVLVYNMRGQAQSSCTSGTVLDQALIVNDAKALLGHVAPPMPVFVGLSIGGIYAAWAAHEGAACDGLVLINTLRRDGPRLRWINDAVVRLSEVGGPGLMRDVMSPLIMNEDWLSANRGQCLGDDGYEPMDTTGGIYNLLANARSTDWDFPYESLTMPTLVITGVHDRVFRDPADIDALFARLPNASRLEVHNAGHMIPVERPEVLSEALLNMAANLIQF